MIRVELTAQVDTDEVAQAIAALKQNEDAREQLLALRQDVEQLQQELEAANEALAAATSPEQVQQLSHERNELLNRAESDAMVAQAWTDWVLVAPFAQPYPSAGLAQVQCLLGLAGRLNPNNPHLAIAQQTVGAKSPPAPPQPRRPPVPHTVPFLPGYYVVPQQPAQPGANPSACSARCTSAAARPQHDADLSTSPAAKSGQPTTANTPYLSTGKRPGSPSCSATVRRRTSRNPTCDHLPGSAETGDRPASTFAKRPQKGNNQGGR